MPDFPTLSSLNLRSLNHTLARLDHYFQARFRSRFAPAASALERFTPPGAMVMDVGANHGKFAKELRRFHGGQCTLWCLEPLEYNLSLLRSIVGGASNVRIFELALSDRAGECEIFIPAKESSKRLLHGSSHLGDAKHAQEFGTSTAKAVYRHTIKTETLDALADREGLKALDLMKIDVEGAEHLVFAGGMKTLANHKPAIYVELAGFSQRYFGHPVNATIASLESLGYRLHRLDEQNSCAIEMREWKPEVRDYLFLHPERHTTTGMK